MKLRVGLPILMRADDGDNERGYIRPGDQRSSLGGTNHLVRQNERGDSQLKSCSCGKRPVLDRSGVAREDGLYLQGVSSRFRRQECTTITQEAKQ